MSELIQFLTSKQTGKVRKAAILLQKKNVPEIEELVIEALQYEIITNKSWETQSELIKALGINRYKKSLDILESIANKNEEYDRITNSTGTSLIRITRLDLSDVSELLKRLYSMKYSLGYGLLDALGYDRMHPSKEDINTIITKCWDFGIKRDKGYVDPRYGLAAACAGWDGETVSNFLIHCVETGDAPLKYVAENSLKKKFIKLR